VNVSYDEDATAAREAAYRLSPTSGMSGNAKWELKT
jgi:hypothetical protein